MVVEEGERNGGGVMGVGLIGMNGFSIEFQNGGGSSAGSSAEHLQTYKRRKYTRLTSTEAKVSEDVKVSQHSADQLLDKTSKESLAKDSGNSSSEQVSPATMFSHAITDGSDGCSLKHRRNIVLEQIYQSLNKSEGGLEECIRESLAFYAESGCTTTVKESVQFGEDSHKCSSQTRSMHHGTQNTDKGHMGVLPNGTLSETDHRTMTELCRRTFTDIIISEKFAQLCNLISENFQGIKVDSFLDFGPINSRMKEGTYDSSPVLFHSDIQQIWSKLQKVGTEFVAFAKSLSDKSRTSYCEQVGESLHSTSGNGKHEFLTQESDMHTKPEQTEPAVYRVCTCRRCGEKADGRDCLVCDSCEEMYHVSCIDPAVEEIPMRSWYCSNCTAKGIESPHENCVVCERLNAPRYPINENGNDEVVTNEETLVELEECSNGLVEDGLQHLEGGKSLRHCNICRGDIEIGENFRICGHSFCLHKYYHVRCLTSKQLNSYGPCWYCPSCLCRGCLSDKDDDKIVLCDGCDHAYHIYCMQPPRTSIPRGKWFCRKCDAEIRRIRQAKREYENLKDEQKEVVDKSGGVDMLLNAAKTLNYVESMAAIGTES